jgi:hypothetical protein
MIIYVVICVLMLLPNGDALCHCEAEAVYSDRKPAAQQPRTPKPRKGSPRFVWLDR